MVILHIRYKYMTKEKHINSEIKFLDVLIRLGPEFINISPEKLYPTLNKSLKAAAIYLDCEYAYFAEFNSNDDVLIVRSVYTKKDVSHTIGRSVATPKVKTDPFLAAMRNGMPVVTNDAKKLQKDTLLDEIYTRYKIRSGIFQLIFYENEPVGVFGFCNFSHTKIWTEKDINILKLGASYVTNFISRYYTEKKLLDTKNKLLLAIDSSGIIIWELDVAGQSFIVTNYDSKTHAEDNKIFSKQNFVNQFIHPDYSKQFIEMLADCESGKTNSMELIVKGATFWKKNVWLDFRAKAALFDKHGKIIKIKGTMVDISHIEEAQAKFATALYLEQKAGNLRNRLISIASHEFRTPLSVISATTDSIIEYYPKMDHKAIFHRMQKIKKQEKIMHGLVRNIINMDKIQSGKIQINLVLEDLASYMKELIADFNGQFDSHEGKRVNRVKHNIGQNKILAAFDQDIMRMIVWNLLDNATKYAQCDKPIEVCLTKQEKHVLLSVRDWGKGISKELQSVLFSEFSRGSDSTNIKGSGLGLVIVNEGVILHGGRLEIDSGKDKGTLVNCFFPIKELVKTRR